MLKWLFDFLDGLDGNVDGAIFGLVKAQKKLDKAVEAQQRIEAKYHDKSLKLKTKAQAAGLNAMQAHVEAERAKRISTKIAELTQ